MKSLKDFIDQNRAAFDHRLPASDGWQKIEKELDANKSRGLWNNLTVWRAAAAILLSLSAFLWVSKSNVPKKEDTSKMQVEFQDLEMFYSSQIDEKVSMISDIQSLDEEDQYSQDLQKLEAMYSVLREQMKTQPSQKVKDALILNLLVRIDLLNQQLKKLEEQKSTPEVRVG